MSAVIRLEGISKSQLTMEDTQEQINILRRSEVFLGLPNEALFKIVSQVNCHTRTCETDEVIFNAGDIAKEIFVLECGQVNLIISNPLPKLSYVQAVMDTVYTGGTFGWSSLIAPYTYTVTARCVVATKVLAINGAELIRFLNNETAIGYEVMKTLNHIVGLRLRDSNRTLFNIIASGGIKDRA